MPDLPFRRAHKTIPIIPAGCICRTAQASLSYCFRHPDVRLLPYLRKLALVVIYTETITFGSFALVAFSFIYV